MGLPQRKFEFYTYTDYQSWPDAARCELIDGVAYAMPPTRTHQNLIGELFRQIATAPKGKPLPGLRRPLRPAPAAW